MNTPKRGIPKAAPRKHSPRKTDLLDLVLMAKAAKLYPPMPTPTRHNRYSLHQGKKEIERRKQQLQRSH